MTKPILYNTQETAAKIGVDPKTLRKWCKAGCSPVAPLPGITPPKWRASDVDAFVAGGAAG